MEVLSDEDLEDVMHCIIIPMGFPFNWVADCERQTANELSKSNIVILFRLGEGVSIKNYLVHPTQLFSRLSKTLYFFRPIYVIPFQRFGFVKRINDRCAILQLYAVLKLQKLARHPMIVWFFSHQRSVLPRDFGRKFAVYDCVDYFRSADPEESREMERFEHILLRQTQVVFCDSRPLYRINRKKHAHTYVVPKGFNKAMFSSFSHVRQLVAVKRPIIGYVGNISTRMDFSFLQSVIAATPRYSYVFIGPVDRHYNDRRNDITDCVRSLVMYPNVTVIDTAISKEMLPTYIQEFTIGLIPYDVSYPFNQYCYPTKTLEYFYMGKPVISTDIRALRVFAPYVTIVKNARGAQGAIRKIVRSTWSTSRRRAQKAIAMQNTWEKKIIRMRDILKQSYSITI